MQAKTSELSGVALDWAVAKCEEQRGVQFGKGFGGEMLLLDEHGFGHRLTCSTNWSQGGPIIERERLNLRASGAGDWVAMTHIPAHPDQRIQYGDTPLIAAMRCYVGSKLGDMVEIPDELMVD